MRAVRLTILLNSILALTLVQGCATNPVTGEQDFVLMSESEEISLGAKTRSLQHTSTRLDNA
jgi:predicted Zn-dependent protease